MQFMTDSKIEKTNNSCLPNVDCMFYKKNQNTLRNRLTKLISNTTQFPP
uniref:Uncharacterized protein n=1 Tax=Rhizophora mucronata TaxID=61149 RepID=A0A2P2P707_RHIMU